MGRDVASLLPGDAFVGRGREVTALRELVGSCRLVTVVGPPGAGKTRLALELLASAPPVGVDICPVDLGVATDDSEVQRAVGAALNVVEVAGKPLMSTIVDRLRHRPTLLLWDNCEGATHACRHLVEQILASCAAVRVLATSRIPLQAAGEVTFQVPPLSLARPGRTRTGSTLDDDDAVTLFLLRAMTSDPSFHLERCDIASVAEICRRLDGVPLAIELAAAWVRVLTPAQILARLGDVEFLGSSGHRSPRRHASLDAAIAWSYGLLSVADRALLRRLSVFAGGCGVDAVEQVCPGGALDAGEVLPALSRLVAASLVGSNCRYSEARYRLPETIRRYGAARLREAGEEDDVCRRHASWFASVAEQAETELTGRRQLDWLVRLDVETQNLTMAMRWAVDRHNPDLALLTASSLVMYWRVRGRFTEGRRWLEAALGLAGGADQLRARALSGAGFMAIMTGDFAAASGLLTRGLAMAEELGDLRGCARARLLLANCRQLTQGTVSALPAIEQAVEIARQADDSWSLAHGLAMASQGHVDLGDPARADEMLAESVAVADEAGEPQSLVFALIALGSLALDGCDLWTAESHLRRAVLAAAQTGQHYEQVRAMSALGEAALTGGDRARAKSTAAEALQLASRLGSPYAMMIAGATLARAIHGEGDLVAARDVFEAALEAAHAAGGTCSLILRGLAQIAHATGHQAVARNLLDVALHVAQETPRRHDVAAALLALGNVARDDMDRPKASNHYVAACRLYDTLGSPDGVATSLEALAGMDVGERPQRAAMLFGAAERIRRMHGLARFPPDVPKYREDVELSRDRLPAGTFSRAWAEGQQLSVADAVALACRPRAEVGDGWEDLTRSERRIIALVADGLTNIEVGARLHISPRTVQSHLTHVYAKLGVPSRTALARKASQLDTGTWTLND